MTSPGHYPEDIYPTYFFFRWPFNNKMQHMYYSLSKELNGDHKYLSCPDLIYKTFRFCAQISC